MRVYSVHIRRHGLDIHRDIAVVKEGFSWPAFLFSGFWALWHRHWLAAVALFAIPAAIAGLARVSGLDPTSQGIVSAAWSIIVGMMANDIRRYFLERAHFVEAGVAAGRSPDEALHAHLNEAEPEPAPAPSPSVQAPPPGAFPP